MTVSDEETSFCKRRTRLEKILIFLTCFFILAIIGLCVGLVIVSQESDRRIEDDQQEICYSPGCIKTANNILKNMNPEVLPCDDFYTFACGNFVSQTIIPDDKTTVSAFTDISDDLEIKLRTIIEDVPSTAPKHALLVSKLYTSCTDEKSIDGQGLSEITALIKELGGWPVVEGTSWSGKFEWGVLAKRLRERGFSTNFIVDIDVDTDWKNTTRNIIQVDQPSLGISREYLIKGDTDERVAAYYKYMTDVAKILGAKDTDLGQLKASLDFEINLATNSVPREERRDYKVLYNPTTVEEIQKNYPWIDNWQNFIMSVLNMPEIEIDQKTKVNVIAPKYFGALKSEMFNDPRVIYNYMIWRAVMESVTFLNKDLRAAQLEFFTKTKGVKERPKRWKECVSLVSNRLPIAVGSMYVRKHFKEEARTASKAMVQDIRNEFKGILKNIDWMDEATKRKASEKATTMTSHIAYPNELVDDKELTEYYEKLTFSPTDSQLKMILLRNKFVYDKAYVELDEPVDKSHWTNHANAAVVNAFYNPVQNSIEFPAGILQGAFFDSDRPRYMNYGAIGFVIGHEITHGFDDQGREFDKEGNLVEWWNDNTQEEFTRKAECIIEQYANYTVDEIQQNVNGINTQGENIADNGGLKEAYLAYQASVERDGKESGLPGLQKYTPEQMFWISAANVWCIKHTDKELENRVKTDVHSPGRFRVIGPMSNSEQFSRDFKCAAGSNMNRKNKCVVW